MTPVETPATAGGASATAAGTREVPETTTAAELLRRCEVLAGYSSMPDGLIERVYLSEEHRQVNALAAEWMQAAGMTTWQDAAGNQCGRLEGAVPGLPALLLGSHLDTVPAAGKYDGILGVLSAIAVVERIKASGRKLPFALEVVAFADEEGTRFGRALLGSRALAGTWDEAWWELHGEDGVSLRDAFTAWGLDPAKVGDAARRPDELIGYLEAHIEQGPYLEDENKALGIVSSIAGARRFILTVTGKAGHSGTPYERRRDALAGAADAIIAIERLARSAQLIATVGHLQVFPDAVNVIPGKVEFSLDLRGEYDSERDRIWTVIQGLLDDICRQRRLRWDSVETHSAPAAVCSARLRGVIAEGIRSTGDKRPMSLFSKAGHDAMAVAEIAEIGMLFVRCEGGVSHNPEEKVTEDDVAKTIDAFERAVLALAEQTEQAEPVRETAKTEQGL
ncbi:allantoate amidohydrolase [Herbiconiux sp. KACC 21604]|uniref:allantoate amidohydrolase n=1 Tax=unclassified Herbiconiux TaxID=2618217 RepID=UPI0014910047|nr:allantoate amidohydrolase [Herbiconiux sp. SALV-R1]QJU54041.1 allantoate amidohydrolase [Herbiconiux sp. SALV-R1]WPO85079.1 allantoate amidohydrolase [Herbiconiux sp. KACC 21604]